jgi:hypothetical protein
MALPEDPAVWSQSMDPADRLDYQMFCRGARPLLETAEQIASYTLALTPEAAALGLTIETGGGRDPVVLAGGDTVALWFSVASGFQTNAAFSGSGAQLGVELTIVTDSVPARTRQRTWALTVKQQ